MPGPNAAALGGRCYDARRMRPGVPIEGVTAGSGPTGMRRALPGYAVTGHPTTPAASTSPAVVRYVPIVAWLPSYDRANLRMDAIAGIVSWGVMVPVAMAYAGLAGMPPETGLVTAFAALTAYAVFGTSRHLKVTTSSSIAIMSASVVGAIAAADPAGTSR